MLQSVFRKRKTRAAFRMLKRLSSAVLLVIRWVRRRRKRKRRRAALVLQAHFRASLCSRLRLCSYGALLCVVYGLRAMHNRAVCRAVYRRFPRLQPADVVLPGLPEAVRRRDRQTRTRLLAGFQPFRWRESSTAAKLHGMLIRTPATLTARIGVHRPRVAPPALEYQRQRVGVRRTSKESTVNEIGDRDMDHKKS